jgi:NAD(P)-dependent dehydrogenase (short-subunit alcohol dehydrogenase family)
LKNIVITGSTRGIGRGLAHAVLARGYNVTVSGRTRDKVQDAVASLSADHGPERVLGQACDVTQFEQVQALWDASREHWGQIDIWINNAGIAHAQKNFWEYPPDEIAAVVETNVIGAMYGTRVALVGMLEQGFGALYNLEGLGSDGRKVEGLTLYGTTKASMTYLTDSLIAETKDTPVLVGAIRPGMVVTDMLTKQYEERPEDWERAKRVFNILADRVDTVAPWLADHILANTKKGARFQYLSRGKVISRFLTAPFNKRDLFGDDGEDRQPQRAS